MCIDLIEKQYNASDPSDAHNVLEKLNNFFLLVDPKAGLILQLFNSWKEPFTNFPVKVEMLKFLAKIFKFADWFIQKNNQYVDTYIRLFKIIFIFPHLSLFLITWKKIVSTIFPLSNYTTLLSSIQAPSSCAIST